MLQPWPSWLIQAQYLIARWWVLWDSCIEGVPMVGSGSALF